MFWTLKHRHLGLWFTVKTIITSLFQEPREKKPYMVSCVYAIGTDKNAAFSANVFNSLFSLKFLANN